MRGLVHASRTIVALLATLALAVPAAAQFSVTTSGNTIIATVGSGLSGSQCCVQASLDDPRVGPGACSIPCGGAKQFPFECNWIGTHTVYACWADDTTTGYVCQQKDIAVTDPLPANCTPQPASIRFDITDAKPADDRRVLLSNLQTDAGGAPKYPYPLYQALLDQDKKLPVTMRVIIGDVATSGVAVTLTVTDPPDPSLYMTTGAPASSNPPASHAGDNAGQILATLTGEVTPQGNNTYSATSGENGAIVTQLNLDATALAGDNYQLSASATLPDGTVIRGHSGVITAWKRLFVEKKQMFRHGALLATNAPAGTSDLIVPATPISDNPSDHFVRGDSVMLLHAPPFGQPKGPGAYYQNVYQISTRPRPFTAAAPAAGAGTVATSLSVNVVGTKTRFTRLNVGDAINIHTAVAGVDDNRTIVAIADNTHLTLDAPTTTTGAGITYTTGDPYLIPGTAYIKLTLNRALGESYQRDPFIQIGMPVLTLNDGVARLGGGSITAADYFDTDDSSLLGTTGSGNAFPAAYTEYIVLGPQPATAPNTALPVPRALFDDLDALTTFHFVEKWFTSAAPAGPAYATPPNQQLLLIADAFTSGSNPQTREYGETGGFAHQVRASIVGRGAVESAVTMPTNALYTANPDRILGKTEVHELTHQWSTDIGAFPGYGDHCFPEVAYDSQTSYQVPPGAGTLYCTMSFDDPAATMLAPWSTPTSPITISAIEYQYANGSTTFHVIPQGTGWHSEYLGIRAVADPWVP